MYIEIDTGKIEGLTDAEREDLHELIAIHDAHREANAQKERYYEGKI